MADQKKMDFESESKADKFRRLGNLRLSKIVDAIEDMESLSHKNNYDYTEEQIDTIFEVIDEALADLKTAFETGKPVVKRHAYL